MKNHMAVDQYGDTEHNLGPHPRKALMERYHTQHADKVFIDGKDGVTRHIGWIVRRRWFTVFRVERMNQPA